MTSLLLHSMGCCWRPCYDTSIVGSCHVVGIHAFANFPAVAHVCAVAGDPAVAVVPAIAEAIF
jgi:hypothetical protein